ncbi:hypothetical protein PCE1_001317 [Barthelona sp. PCE]
MSENVVVSLSQALKSVEKVERNTRPVVGDRRNRKQRKTAKQHAVSREDQNRRTAFVGNVPLEISRKAFSKFLLKNEVDYESFRFRSRPKRLETKKNAEKEEEEEEEIIHTKNSQNIYVVMKDLEGLEKLVQLNGIELSTHKLKIDFADKKKSERQFDSKRTLFIGNLPKVVVEDVFLFFLNETCGFEEDGSVESVRIVRDERTDECKGFGYVRFSNDLNTMLARKRLEGAEFGDKKLRVEKCHSLKRQKEQKIEKAKDEKKKQYEKRKQTQRIKNEKARKRTGFMGQKASADKPLKLQRTYKKNRRK